MLLALNARFLTQRVTGVQRYAQEVTRRLGRLLGESNVLLIAPPDAPPTFAGLPVRVTTGRLPGHLWEQVVLPLAVRQTAADLLFSPGNVGPLAVRNQVVCIHDMAVFARPEGFRRSFRYWYRLLLPRLARRVAKVVTVSEFSRKEAVRYLGLDPRKIVVIPNGVDERFAPADSAAIERFRKQRNLPRRYVLALGSRGANKNLSGVLRAWERLCRQGHAQEVWLVLAGERAHSLRADPLEELIRGLPRVMDLGYVPDADLPALYSAAEALVFPSFYEGFGLPPLEAMACGTPVVVSNVTSLPEVVGDAGVYVDPYNVEDIARGIHRILVEDRLRHYLRRQALARARLFTWENAARKLVEVLAAAVDLRRS